MSLTFLSNIYINVYWLFVALVVGSLITYFYLNYYNNLQFEEHAKWLEEEGYEVEHSKDGWRVIK